MLSLHIRWKIIEKTLEGLTTRQIAKHLVISKTAILHLLDFFYESWDTQVQLSLFFAQATQTKHIGQILSWQVKNSVCDIFFLEKNIVVYRYIVNVCK